MNTDHFVKVFDVLDSGFRDWSFSAFGLIFVAVGIVIFALPKILKTVGIPHFNFEPRYQTFFRYGFLGFAVLWTAASFIATYPVHLRHNALAQANGCRVVEGPVEQFVPMPYAGHAVESFSVAGVPFEYSDYMITDGFNNTSSHGGPINGNSYVRICYDPLGNAILRLEIRDFAGVIKDYAKGQSIFPTAEDVRKLNGKNPPINLPWYSNLFFVLYILDFILIQALFLPYLRTFFRIKTTAASNFAVPDTLEPNKKIKLRNSMIYWDRENQVIWLRPRGYNLVEVPLVVATLKIDANCNAISGSEIRFSSGFPFTMTLLLWTAYVSFSAVIPSHSLAPLFVGFAALMTVIGGFFSLRKLRSRMDILVEEALSELKEMQVKASRVGRGKARNPWSMT
jgi:hypothetical protein